jgi:ComG operon protein 7
MNNNEKGFTYPLTLCLLIIFLVFFSMNIEKLLSEQKLAHETAVILRQEYYFHSSVRKLEMAFQTDGTFPEKGTFRFVSGTIDYQAEPLTGYIQKVNFTLRLNTSGETVIGRGFFDTRTKSLSKWIELK